VFTCDHQLKKVLNRRNKTSSAGFVLVSISLSNPVGCLPSSRDSYAVACTAEVTSTKNKRLYKQAKDLHLDEWLLSQTPAELQ